MISGCHSLFALFCAEAEPLRDWKTILYPVIFSKSSLRGQVPPKVDRHDFGLWGQV